MMARAWASRECAWALWASTSRSVAVSQRRSRSPGTAPLATILNNPKAFRGKRVAVILTGGNVDLDTLHWVKSVA